MVSPVLHEVNGVNRPRAAWHRRSRRGRSSARPESLIGRRAVSYNTVYRVTPRIDVTSVSTLPRPITDYQSLSGGEQFQRTVHIKQHLGDQVMVLGHLYQRDDGILHADFRGDSLLVSKLAAERSDRPFVVFCGVHIMSEIADILSRSGQSVIL